MKAHRYFSYKKKNEDFYRCNKLLPVKKIDEMKAELISMDIELHESTHIFDGNGGTISSSIYADFDGEGCFNDLINLLELLKEEFSVLPLIYFSGNRGFHLEYPITVISNMPHLVSKMFFTTLTKSSFLDKQIYAQRHLMRSDGSIHFKTGLHKTGITYDELQQGFEKVKILAAWQQPNRVSFEKQDTRRLIMFLQTILYKVNEEIKHKRRNDGSSELGTSVDMTPCLQNLIKEQPQDGEWNETITYLGRWFNSKDYDLYSALDEMFQHEHWLDDEGHVRKVFRSIFANQSKFGCRGIELLERNCCITCPFNEELLDEM
jgi:hypothetical protein